MRRGLRRREAQYRCPDLAVLDRDLAEEARAFEPVVVAVEAVAPGWRWSARDCARCPPAVRPATSEGTRRRRPTGRGGLAAGPGDRCRAGVAEGAFAAALAARAGQVVPAGRTPEFLAAPRSTCSTGPTSPTCCAGSGSARSATSPPARGRRLGPVRCRGRAAPTGWPRAATERPLAARRPPPDLAGHAELDPPAERVDAAAFAARPLADELHARLAAARAGLHPARRRGRDRARASSSPGLAPRGRAHRRGDRRPRALAARRLADRHASARRRPPRGDRRCCGSVARTRWSPHGGRQLGLWGTARRRRAAERVRPRAGAGCRGCSATSRGHRGARRWPRAGGAGPATSPWGDPRERAERPTRAVARAVPAPSPGPGPPGAGAGPRADAAGAGRGQRAVRGPAPPARLRVGERPRRGVSLGRAVAGRRALVGRPRPPRSGVRFQVATADGAALAADRRGRAAGSSRPSTTDTLMGFDNPPMPGRSWNGGCPAVPRRSGSSPPAGDGDARRLAGAEPRAAAHTAARRTGRPTIARASARPVRRAARALQLQLPRRREPAGGAGRGGRRLGLDALALTDHDGFYGVVRFAEAAARSACRRSSAPSSPSV